jgi:adenine deaminase
VHGTVGTISDPHEIANVCGMEGVEFMLKNAKTVPFKCCFGAPSCVPATSFETAGATLTPTDVDALMKRPDIFYLSEVMNFPGVLNRDADVLAKIDSAKKVGKPVDGHAPGLRGDAARNYIQTGISTDHECFQLDEAEEKLSLGMKILIREGSAAKNFDTLIPLMKTHADQLMFCSDDKHPDSLLEGHINQLCARAIKAGMDIFDVLYAACIHPVLHYNMPVGLLRVGDAADFIIVDDLKEFKVSATYIDGVQVAKQGNTMISRQSVTCINQFNTGMKQERDFHWPHCGEKIVPVIEAWDGQLITGYGQTEPTVFNGMMVSNAERDLLKIAVINRYNEAPVAMAFIKNIGLKKGAIASTVAHDSHNLVVVGTDDASICRIANQLIDCKGGLGATDGNQDLILPLPIAGLMSDQDGFEVAEQYTRIDQWVKQELGSSLQSPFMTLSFMALLVIPRLKLSDKGLFDGEQFRFV